MKIAIAIGSPPDSPLAHTAFQIANAIERSPQEIYCIFFHGAGVLNCFSQPADQTHSLCSAWKQFFSNSPIDAILCSAAIDKYGFSHNPTSHPSIEIGGLGSLIQITMKADKTLSF